MDKIINASHSKDFITYANSALVNNRYIVDITYYAGSYGMGGYVFFGLRLSQIKERKQEWLVCTIFSANDWLTVNGRWLSCHPTQYSQQKPLTGTMYSQEKERRYLSPLETWDDFQPLILDKKINDFDCKKNSCQIIIEENIIIAITADSSSRPWFYGTKKPRELGKDDDLRRGWILARDINLFL